MTKSLFILYYCQARELKYWSKLPGRKKIAMSMLSRLAVVASVVSSAAIILFVHKKQEYDRVRLHQGVIVDQERQERKRMNLQELNSKV